MCAGLIVTEPWQLDVVLIPLPRDNLSVMNERAPGEKLFWSVPMHYVHPRLKGFTGPLPLS